MDLENFPTSEAACRMLETVSNGFYDKSYVGKWLYQVMGLEIDDARQIFDELPYQIFPETATWGLFYHEIKYGLPVRNDLSYEERRKIIMTKRDTRSPMNPWQMEQVIKSMTGFEAEIDEDSSEPNTFSVYLSGEGGEMEYQRVIDKLNQIKQSHVQLVRVEQVVGDVYPVFWGMVQTATEEVTIKFNGGEEIGI